VKKVNTLILVLLCFFVFENSARSKTQSEATKKSKSDINKPKLVPIKNSTNNESLVKNSVKEKKDTGIVAKRDLDDKNKKFGHLEIIAKGLKNDVAAVKICMPIECTSTDDWERLLNKNTLMFIKQPVGPWMLHFVKIKGYKTPRPQYVVVNENNTSRVIVRYVDILKTEEREKKKVTGMFIDYAVKNANDKVIFPGKHFVEKEALAPEDKERSLIELGEGADDVELEADEEAEGVNDDVDDKDLLILDE